MEKKKKEYILHYDMVFVNLFAFGLLLFMCVLTFGIVQLIDDSTLSFVIEIQGGKSCFYLALFYFVLLVWMILHEIIHAIAYQVMGAKKENIVFGAALEKGVFYCKCREYISRNCIMVSLLSPFLFIGVFTYILGFCIHSIALIWLSIFNISGAAGDLMLFFFFLKQNKDVEFKELGFSSPFCLRTIEDLTNKKYIGIKNIHLVEDKSETMEEPEKKLTISKASFVVGVVFFVLLLLLLVLSFL